MKLQGLSVKRLFFYVIIGLILSMTVAAAILYYITEQAAVLAVGAVQILCALAWLLALTQISLNLRSMRDLRSYDCRK